MGPRGTACGPVCFTIEAQESAGKKVFAVDDVNQAHYFAATAWSVRPVPDSRAK